MWYRRITEYNDVDSDLSIANANANEQIYVNGKSIDVDPQISDNPKNLSRCREPRLGHLNHDDITRFKRVRVLSTNSRSREAELVALNADGTPGLLPALSRQTVISRNSQDIKRDLQQLEHVLLLLESARDGTFLDGNAKRVRRFEHGFV